MAASRQIETRDRPSGTGRSGKFTNVSFAVREERIARVVLERRGATPSDIVCRIECRPDISGCGGFIARCCSESATRSPRRSSGPVRPRAGAARAGPAWSPGGQVTRDRRRAARAALSPARYDACVCVGATGVCGRIRDDARASRAIDVVSGLKCRYVPSRVSRRRFIAEDCERHNCAENAGQFCNRTHCSPLDFQQ
jgi:hypothetical protein